MDNKEQTYYTLLLRQYIDGSISDMDKFILEKRALDDPFLFETLEGYQHKDAKTTDSLKKLESNISAISREKKSKTISFLNYGVAASLVLLLGVSLWFFNSATSVDDLIVMDSEITEDKNREQLTFENEYEEQALKDISLEQSSNNQYDSPKAIISQADNTKISDVIQEQRNSAIQTMEKKYSLDDATKVKPESDLALQTNNRPESKKRIIKQNQGATTTQTNIDKSIIPSKSTTGASKDMDISIAQQPSLNATRASSLSIDLPRNEYIPSIKPNILVAPSSGMTAFMTKNSLPADILKRKRTQTQSEIIAEFHINKHGQISNLKLLNDMGLPCEAKIIEAIKKEDKWLTIPTNSETSVRIKITCL